MHTGPLLRQCMPGYTLRMDSINMERTRDGDICTAFTQSCREGRPTHSWKATKAGIPFPTFRAPYKALWVASLVLSATKTGLDGMPGALVSRAELGQDMNPALKPASFHWGANVIEREEFSGQRSNSQPQERGSTRAHSKDNVFELDRWRLRILSPCTSLNKSTLAIQFTLLAVDWS